MPETRVEYSVKLRSTVTSIERMLSTFSKLNPRFTSAAGENHYVQFGKLRPNRSDQPNSTNEVILDSGSEDLEVFLTYLASRIETSKIGIDTDGLEVWATYYRFGQMNGELTPNEIAGLANLRASFCWSVVFDEYEH